jgi:hypothetical protein
LEYEFAMAGEGVIEKGWEKGVVDHGQIWEKIVKSA